MKSIMFLLILILLGTALTKTLFWLFPYILLVVGVYLVLNMFSNGPRSRPRGSGPSAGGADDSQGYTRTNSNPNVIDVEFHERDVEDGE